MIEIDKEEEEEYILIVEYCATKKSVNLLSYSHSLLDYCDERINTVKNPDENIMGFLTINK